MITGTVVENIETPRFAGHETFSMRYGWLKKAVDAASVEHLDDCSS